MNINVVVDWLYELYLLTKHVKASGQKNPLALQLMAQGLYNHSTMALDDDDMDDMDDLDDQLIHDE